MLRPIAALGRLTIRFVEEMGRILILLAEAVYWTFRPPFNIRNVFTQMEFVGVKSIFVVSLTGGFTGMVFALQSYKGFHLFGAESLVGPVVTLSITRELSPVLTSLMVTGRAGSAMAAEIGTMRVTEQIDALRAMAVNPVNHLVAPRILAGTLMTPVLTGVTDFIGIAGGYFVGVYLLGMDRVTFLGRIEDYVEPADIMHGLSKAVVFGLILSLVGCYKGMTTDGGAQGVGRSTTQAVVIASILILVSDYLFTALVF